MCGCDFTPSFNLTQIQQGMFQMEIQLCYTALALRFQSLSSVGSALSTSHCIMTCTDLTRTQIIIVQFDWSFYTIIIWRVFTCVCLHLCKSVNKYSYLNICVCQCVFMYVCVCVLFHREEACKGFPKVADGLSLGFVLTRTLVLGGRRFWNVECIGKRLGFAIKRKKWQ